MLHLAPVSQSVLSSFILFWPWATFTANVKEKHAPSCFFFFPSNLTTSFLLSSTSLCTLHRLSSCCSCSFWMNSSSGGEHEPTLPCSCGAPELGATRRCQIWASESETLETSQHLGRETRLSLQVIAGRAVSKPMSGSTDWLVWFRITRLKP